MMGRDHRLLKFIDAIANIIAGINTMTARQGRRANNPFPVLHGSAEPDRGVPWSGNRKLHLVFGENPYHRATP